MSKNKSRTRAESSLDVGKDTTSIGMNEDISADASVDESIGGSIEISMKESTDTSMNTSVESVLIQYSDSQNSGVEVFT
ncbi:hypothetical protein KQI74_12320 [Paenibacillus barcinonensis]|uniref:hypothetical protein n=1 Tax=Paenibacillus barcinonensis TaxID=198119 RepID=UPI001C118689|nr:hypothetical protein [Paenibacillus barcinonensis]MBU5353077.1 hypothetical protein [Paenibacillus barcinonensis]